VAPPPCQASGQFTFGSLASLYKITPQVVRHWAEILRETPESRLLLRNSGFRTAGNRQWFHEQFAQQGIEPGRLSLHGPTDHFSFLRTYDEIDLALDTFPYNGGTTTTEALWQGVAVVAIHGDRWTSRVSSSLLANAGLREFVTADSEGYVKLAVSTANNPAARDRLAQLRLSLRGRLGQSGACDVDGFVKKMEAIYVSIILRSRSA
jgi:predicted O-linked N-acetylglucosamine transferase (SPINDLY family)